MKKVLSFLIITLFTTQVKTIAQCTVAVQNISENFDGYTGNDLPACWNRQNNCYVVGDQLRLRTVNQAEAMAILPKTVNARGVLSFTSRYIYPWGPAATIEIGVVDDPANPSSFVTLASYAANSQTLTAFSFDLSGYTGSYQYVAMRMATNTAWEVYFEDLTYTSGCVSNSVTAIGQNISVQLGTTGEVSVDAADLDNGSTSDCGTPTFSLSQSTFSCSDIGVNQVTLTATDISGNTSSTTVEITVQGAITDETVSAAQTSLCSNGSTTVSTGGSMLNINYSLRNDTDNSVIAGPTTGTGSALTFNTGTLSSTTTFNVVAETIGSTTSSAVDLDGSNDYINVPVTSFLNYEQGFTFEATLKANSGGSRAIFSAGTASTSDIEVYVQAGGNRLIVVYNRNSPGYTLAAKEYPVPPLNTWFHLAVTYDGSTTKVYYDGVEKTALATTAGSPLHKTTGSQFDFGFMRSNINNNWGFATHLGAFDEIRLWDDARSIGEIQGLMNECSNGTGSGLVAVYPFNDGSGLVANDIVGGNHGTLVNMDATTDWVAGSFACNNPSDPACDFEMTQTVTVTIGDAIDPVPDSQSLSTLTAQCEVTSLTAPTAIDNCAGTITGTHNASLPISSNTTITWTYDDGNGNTATQTQEVVINDNADPVPDVVSLPIITEYCEVTSVVDPSATDNCAGILFGTTPISLPITATTTLTWTYDDGNGNTVTQTQDIVIADIDVAVSQNGGTISADQVGAMYQWVDCDNSNAPIANETDQDFTPSVSGNYAVEVTINGCTETSACTSMIVTGINEANMADVRIFPVPATNVLNILSTETIENLIVYAMDGKLVSSDAQNTKAIDVSALAKGMYLLVVQTEKGTAQRRFVVE
ncbi:MAG: T9SS type A sorting domain-containing protein [Flavobacteriales bacterium]|nr:T9SS type A sorting domain-containing protein [Flavobacteriales bacterium]MCB9192270.1 T9SS type A sorting domain-containing protein [Flavobacteriales bacterium]